MKIISLIDTHAVLETILRHLKLWDRPERPPPPPTERTVCYDIDVFASDDAAQWFDVNEQRTYGSVGGALGDPGAYPICPFPLLSAQISATAPDLTRFPKEFQVISLPTPAILGPGIKSN